jgi:hypothetical protein
MRQLVQNVMNEPKEGSATVSARVHACIHANPITVRGSWNDLVVRRGRLDVIDTQRTAGSGIARDDSSWWRPDVDRKAGPM